MWLWLTTGLITQQWVAVHRKHHANVEKNNDPHSPQIYGIWRVLFMGAGLYRRAAADHQTIQRYGYASPQDWIERHLYSRYPNLGILITLLINHLLFSTVGLLIWGIQMIWIPFFAAGIINGLGHWRGYRNFDTQDRSTNIIPCGLLVGGEEMHNNHHAFSSSAKFSCKWWEFDLGWGYIRILCLLGLARVKKQSLAITQANRGRIEHITVASLISSRLHIMADYSRQVIRRVYKQELSRVSANKRQLYKRGRRLLLHTDRLLDTSAKKDLHALLSHSDALKAVYEFRHRLQALWAETKNKDKLVPALQDWCRQAENSGIEALQTFANRLAGDMRLTHPA